MDKVSLLFVENLALADFTLALTRYLIKLITLCSSRWVMGEAVCFITVFISYIVNGAEILITTAISVYRLFVLTHTMDSHISTKYVKMFIVLVWLSTGCVVAVLTIGDTIVYFNPDYFDCDWHLVSLKLYWKISECLYLALPVAVIIIINIWILIIAGRHAKNKTGEKLPSKSAVITVSSICWVFVVSYIPILIDLMIDDPPSWFNTLAVYTLSISVIGNPIIYTITNNRFRCFIKEMFVMKRKNTSEKRGPVKPNTCDQTKTPPTIKDSIFRRSSRFRSYSSIAKGVAQNSDSADAS